MRQLMCLATQLLLRRWKTQGCHGVCAHSGCIGVRDGAKHGLDEPVVGRGGAQRAQRLLKWRAAVQRSRERKRAQRQLVRGVAAGTLVAARAQHMAQRIHAQAHLRRHQGCHINIVPPQPSGQQYALYYKHLGFIDLGVETTSCKH